MPSNLYVNKSQRTLKKLYIQRYLLIMLVPGVLWLFVFAYVPLAGWVMGFTNYKLGQGFFSGKWVAFYHFKSFFNDTREALSVLRNTLVINVSSLIITLILGCSFAILLNEVRTGWIKKVVQTSSFFPFFISYVIVYSIANTFLSINTGVINTFLVNLGILDEGINFLGGAKYSWAVIISINIWKMIGYNGVIFIASIASIDQEQYQAAEIDGAGRFAKIFHITLPGLSTTFVVLLIMNSGWIFSSNFEQYYIFTNASNISTMEVFDMYIYRYGLQLLNFSYATAVGIMKTFVSILFIYTANYFSKRLADKGIF